MSLTLHNLKTAHGATRGKKRIGRGLGSKGTTAGRGQKGQTSRAGSHGLKRIGMRHMMLATPKLRGFKSGKPVRAVVNLDALSSFFIAGEVVTPKVLLKKGLIATDKFGVKILGDGEIKIPLTVKDCALSASARVKIMDAKGTVEA